MKRYIRRPDNLIPKSIRYEVHWVSPRGKDCLLGGSKSLEGAFTTAENQARQIFENPWETDEDKYHFIDNIYIYDLDTDSEVDFSIDLDDYFDGLMSELDSRIKRK